jgi:ubiquinone/menaquinone biosynthesis C-methylase UbiE
MSSEREEKLAKLYDDELLPAYAARFAALLLRQLDPPLVRPDPGVRILEVGCATGHLTRELVRRFPDAARMTVVDESRAMLGQARLKLAADRPRLAPVFELAAPDALPLGDGEADLAVSNLAVWEAADPLGAVGELARVLSPGGRALVTLPLRGSWAEFVDLLGEVLRESGRRDGLTALERHERAFPDGGDAVAALEAAGLVDVTIDVDRWELLFRSAREFFFAPLVELGPLPAWKRLTGGGDAMQDAFFFTKEAIDAYFKGRPFAVTIVGAVVTGRKP